MRLISNALKQGARIRDFEIVGILGAGGFGTTYKTKHTNLKRAYAIKEYFPTSLAARMPDGINVAPVGSEAKFDYHLGLQRFISEARTLNYLRHPNIVSVVDCLEENNTAYMVIEFEEG
jgi:serine/threonine protein kinase